MPQKPKPKALPPPADPKPFSPEWSRALFLKEYAPGVLHFLRQLADLDEETMRAWMPGLPEDKYRELSLLLTGNLEKVAGRVRALPDLLALSLIAMRERTTHPQAPALAVERGA